MLNQKFVVHPEEVETVITDWTTAKVMCDPRTSGLQMSAVDLFFEPGHGHSRHNHVREEQIIYVVSGTGEHMTELPNGERQVEKIRAGSMIHIPRGAYHSTHNTGWTPMHVIAVFTPPGPEAALREVGDSGGVGTAFHKVLPAGDIPVRK